MASQQTLIAETIRGMKVALRRRDDESDSDSSVRKPTNRGNKLKRQAHDVREGRLDTTGGKSYRRKIDHAGYQRYIINKNPPRYDEDGDLVEGDDENGDTDASPNEENPFDEVKLEYLLAPLTSAADLANHPALSVPYTTKHLTQMAEDARDMLHRERENLWKMKQLLQRFRGDEMWVPLEKTETLNDPLLLDADAMDGFTGVTSPNESSTTFDGALNSSVPSATAIERNTEGGGSLMADSAAKLDAINGVAAIDMAQNLKRGDIPAKASTEDVALAKLMTNGASGTHKPINGDRMMVDGPSVESAAQDRLHEGKQEDGEVALDGDNAEGIRNSVEADENDPNSMPDQPVHAMTTRAKARTPPSPDSQASLSASPVPSSMPSINNFFITPASSLADRDFGLPAPEAEETRRVLLSYVQKQEEVVRGTEQMLMGLLRADRRRKDVWSWCRAEGHVGEMSDGEDWVDQEEWGLSGELVKGKEEEDNVEEEGVRKGRRRRDPKKTTAGA